MTDMSGNDPDLITRRITRARFEKLKRTPKFLGWKREQYLVQDGMCAWCVRPLSAAFRKVHVDHALAIFHGGTNAYENLVLAHARCNMGKWIRVDGVPQWILNNKRKREREQLLAAQRRQLEKMMEDAWQERLAWWLRSWIYDDVRDQHY